MDFKELVMKVHAQKGCPLPLVLPREGQSLYAEPVLLCFDPGHTTGWAVYVGYELVDSGEIDTSDMETAPHTIRDLMDTWKPSVLLLEDYRVYKWRAKHHVGSEMLTTRVIGCIETFSVIYFINHLYKQPAHTAKGFCDDAKLKEWGFYKKGERHARDAIRHGAYFLLFGPIQKKDKSRSTVG